MLVIRPRGTQGAGIFDVFSKVANSALLKKVINSGVGKKIVQQATKENFRKVANSAIGKQLQTAVVKGAADAAEKAANTTFQKLGISSEPGFVAKASEKAANSALQKLGLTELGLPNSSSASEKAALAKVFAANTLPAPKRKRKRTKPGRRPAKRKRTTFGSGIILE